DLVPVPAEPSMRLYRMSIREAAVFLIILFHMTKYCQTCRIFLLRLPHILKEAFFHRIIRIHKPDILSLCMTDAGISGLAESFIFLMMDCPDPGIFSRQLIGQFPCPVRGSVFHNDQFPILK